MIAIIVFVVIAIITVFSINLAKARHVYEENIIIEQTNFFDVDYEEKLFYAYTKGNSIFIEQKTFGGTTLFEREIVSESPHKIDLLVVNGGPYLTWVSINNQINLYDGENIIIIVEEGSTPRLFSVGETVYITWIHDKTLFVRPLDNPLAEWQIDSMISDYSIYHYDNKIYFTYTKDSIICFKTFSQGTWSDCKTIYNGYIPHYIKTDETSYIYHKNSHGNLGCFYGFSDDIKLVTEITQQDVQEIITHKDILAFTLEDQGLFMQRITSEGFSNIYQVTANPATQINVFYADDDDLMFTYLIEERVISKFVSLPSVATNETLKPLIFEIFGDDTAKKNVFDYIADYNLRNVAPEGTVANFILAHSGESLVFLGVFSIASIIALTYLMGRRRDKKNEKKNEKKNAKK